MSDKIKFHKILEMPASPEPNSIYFVKKGEEIQGFVTDISGVATPLGNIDLIKKALNETYPRTTKIGFAISSDFNLVVGEKSTRSLPYNIEILSWEITVDTNNSNNVKIDIEKTSDFSTYSSIITGEENKPSLENAKTATSNSLTGWETTIGKENYFKFSITEVSNIKTLMFSLEIKEVII